MSGNKHTSGPWERIDTPDYAEIHPMGQRLQSAIALVGTPGDADLIAAAPDLLAALKQIVFDWDGEPEDMIEAHAAIAKAEGR